MRVKALAMVVAGASTMLLLASLGAASADELNTADDHLALSDRPAGNETLAQQSGSMTPVNTLDTNNNIMQQQPNTIIAPTAVTRAVTSSGSIAIGNDSSSASIASSTSATVYRNGVQ